MTASMSTVIVKRDRGVAIITINWQLRHESLSWQPERGVTFAFMEESWPSHSGAAPFTRVARPALLLMLMVSLFITSFLFR